MDVTRDPHAQFSGSPAELCAAGLNAWHTVMLDFPLRLAAETMRFTSRRLKAQADHLAALVQCRSFKDAVGLQTTFVVEGASDYRAEAFAVTLDLAETTFAKAA
ncbi:MAG: phasin family protein [Methylobacterium sp.]|uniref:phasin family protein n=1 Tax=Methylobacterium sp. TaxID=409 RepID=UPI0025F187BB|nr:phasin family protein [Methylobacterium sp.]MBX9933505.1 phasin family protein [Methylobacterium sp.]